MRDALARCWHDLRDPDERGIAPYPERAETAPRRWDRPFDRAIGTLMTRTPWHAHALRRRAEAIWTAAERLRDLADEALDDRCRSIGTRLLRAGLTPPLVDEALALVREVTGRCLGMRHHVVQLMGGLAMLDGCLAEMATGEGKTITALLPAVTAALAGQPVHVFTVNDYLAERDAAKLTPVFHRFGLSIGLVVHGQEPPERRRAYACDILYGTNKEITFDYLRDLTAMGTHRGVGRRRVAELFGRGGDPLTMRGLHFAIVDEADSIFIDEARTPLILSATLPAKDDGLYPAALDLAERLEEGRDYAITPADRAVHLTPVGQAEVEALSAGLPHDLWRIRRAREELASQAISAVRLFHRDREYLVADGKVQIIDESTGRVMADRAWERGLHQMIECKEAVELSGGRETMARITYQRFFRRYLKVAGMSGTAREVAGELWADYGVRVTAIPTHRPRSRIDRGTRLCRTEAEKWALVVDTVRRIQTAENARPILIGTRSVAASDAVAAALAATGIRHRVINARQDAEEAEIVGEAGESGAVTVATNMAGRGTDIELAPAAKAAGGLHVILTEFHETPRIDRQLYGRAGRQGDPGSFEAITALTDDLYQLFAPASLRALLAGARSWPVSGRGAELIRTAAQGAAERRHAGARRQTELMEQRLKTSMAFAGAD